MPTEISDQTVGETLSQYGKFLSVDREMLRDWHDVESGVRIVRMAELTEGIPRRVNIGSYKVETRYRSQVPLCGRCGTYGHRIATCINDVKCFRYCNEGHIQRNCFKCFLCGSFSHVRADCPENPLNRQIDENGDDDGHEDLSEQHQLKDVRDQSQADGMHLSQQPWNKADVDGRRYDNHGGSSQQ